MNAPSDSSNWVLFFFLTYARVLRFSRVATDANAELKSPGLYLLSNTMGNNGCTSLQTSDTVRYQRRNSTE